MSACVRAGGRAGMRACVGCVGAWVCVYVYGCTYRNNIGDTVRFGVDV